MHDEDIDAAMVMFPGARFIVVSHTRGKRGRQLVVLLWFYRKTSLRQVVIGAHAAELYWFRWGRVCLTKVAGGIRLARATLREYSKDGRILEYGEGPHQGRKGVWNTTQIYDSDGVAVEEDDQGVVRPALGKGGLYNM